MGVFDIGLFESKGESLDPLYTFKQSARVDRDWAIDSAPHVRSSALRRQKPLKPCDFPREGRSRDRLLPVAAVPANLLPDPRVTRRDGGL